MQVGNIAIMNYSSLLTLILFVVISPCVDISYFAVLLMLRCVHGHILPNYMSAVTSLQ